MESYEKIYNLSWVAYFRPVLTTMLAVVVSFYIAEMMERQWLVGVIVAIAFICLAYQVLYIRSVKIYIDDKGVWLYQGVLPWQKGFYGVKWRDIDGALYNKGLISWACRSYAIHVVHRYTKNSEIYLRHVRHGNLFVETVNDELNKRFRETPTQSSSENENIVID